LRRATTLATLSMSLCALGAAPALAADGGGHGKSKTNGDGGAGAVPAPPAGNAGGASLSDPVVTPSQPTVLGLRAKAKGGVAYAPLLAPLEVKEVIWAANKIRRKPYVFGGGHQKWRDRGYDCSGTVSFALHGGGLLDVALDSSSFMKWEERGKGEWITVYTNPGHAYMVVAGLRLDTSGPGERGPRWRTIKRPSTGFKARHPLGF
jgi:hypothetical protein